MLQEFTIGLWLLAASTAGEATPQGFDWSGYEPPDWRLYQAKDASSLSHVPCGSGRGANARPDRTTFRDLKCESDESLARRLLGEAGERIAFVDRHKHRWYLYSAGDDAAAESIDLYTHPYPLGTQFGLCGVEKYSVKFGDDGRIKSVRVSQRYGVEGPIFQKSGYDWNQYRKVMCASAPAAHAPSYFPAKDSIEADDAAALLVVLFDLAASSGPLPFPLECRTWQGREACSRDPRSFLGALRLNDIDELSLVNCRDTDDRPKSVCFTMTTGEFRLGHFPKYITVKGSTYLNKPRLDSVEVIESFTIS